MKISINFKKSPRQGDGGGRTSLHITTFMCENKRTFLPTKEYIFRHITQCRVPDFTISDYSSSCNYSLSSIILAPLLSLSMPWHPLGRMEYQEIERQRKKREKPFTC